MSNFLLVSTTDNSGQPDGVSPRMGKLIADELGVAVQLIPFQGPGDIADAAVTDGWDIANIAAEPERARTIQFSPAYCEIQATYLLPPGSSIKHIEDVDSPGNRIAVKERAAYDLWLNENLRYATLVRAETLDASFSLLQEQGLEVLAGLRPKLLEQQAQMPGSHLFDESFTAVQQSIGCQTGKPAAAQFLHELVERKKRDGTVDKLIEQFGVQGRLSVAAAVPT